MASRFRECSELGMGLGLVSGWLAVFRVGVLFEGWLVVFRVGLRL